MNTETKFRMSSKNFSVPLLMGAASILLAACGGGGGSTPDTTAPTVSVSPATAATGVARDTTVTATFSEDMFATTIGGSSFTVSSGGNVTGTVAFDALTNIATFTPSEALFPLTTYTANLTNAITDLAGNALATTNWSFTTGDGSWGTAELIETDNAGEAYTPMVAFDDRGNAIAVWYQGDGTRFNIWANYYTAGTGWGSAELIETLNAGHALISGIAFDNNGNAFASWYQQDGTRYDAWVNRYTSGSGWGTPELIESDNSGNAVDPRIAFDSNDNAIAVWHQSDGTRFNIWANYYTAGSGWGTPTLIETDNTGHAIGPQIAFDSTGNANVVWTQYDGPQRSVWANRYTDGSGWGAAELIETDNAGDANNHKIASDSNGNMIAVWNQHDGTLNNIWANRYTPGGGWGTAELIESDSSGHAHSPEIAIDSNGNAIVVWDQQGATLQYDIRANRYTAGSGWGTAETIETDNAGDARSPSIAMDSNDNAIAVWQQHDGTRINTMANRYISGSGWGSAVLIESNNDGEAVEPQLAIDNRGSAIAVWYQDDGTRPNIWANRFE